jgi:uncharacterized protein with PIN domain
MNYGKCPKCDTEISEVESEKVSIKSPDGKTWKGAGFRCPRCHVVLGVGVDPLILKGEIVREVLEGLAKAR